MITAPAHAAAKHKNNDGKSPQPQSSLAGWGPVCSEEEGTFQPPSNCRPHNSRPPPPSTFPKVLGSHTGVRSTRTSCKFTRRMSELLNTRCQGGHPTSHFSVAVPRARHSIRYPFCGGSPSLHGRRLRCREQYPHRRRQHTCNGHAPRRHGAWSPPLQLLSFLGPKAKPRSDLDGPPLRARLSKPREPLIPDTLARTVAATDIRPSCCLQHGSMLHGMTRLVTLRI